MLKLELSWPNQYNIRYDNREEIKAMCAYCEFIINMPPQDSYVSVLDYLVNENWDDIYGHMLEENGWYKEIEIAVFKYINEIQYI